MINCKDCKYFRIEYGLPDNMGVCDGISSDEDYKVYDKIGNEILAFTEGYYDRGSLLVVHKRFGCILGEKKEEVLVNND